MKKNSIIFSGLMVLAMYSCQNNNSDSHHGDEMEAKPKLEVEVVNTIDPICGMEIPKYMSDTLNYESELYGFCSAKCKHDFSESPEEYLDKIN